MRYKAALGPYKMFVKTQTVKLAIADGQNGDFVIRPAGDNPEPCPVKASDGKKTKEAADWRKDLERAWGNYCREVPKAERSFEVFASVLPKGARSAAPAAAAATEGAKKSSPKVAPESEPATKKKKMKKKAA